MNIPEIFSINTIAFTVINYPMSYVEFTGTVLTLLSVWLVSKKNKSHNDSRFVTGNSANATCKTRSGCFASSILF